MGSAIILTILDDAAPRDEESSMTGAEAEDGFRLSYFLVFLRDVIVGEQDWDL